MCAGNRLERVLGAGDLESLGDQRLTLALDRPDLRRLVRVRDDALIVHPTVRLRLGERAHRQRDQSDETHESRGASWRSSSILDPAEEPERRETILRFNLLRVRDDDRPDSPELGDRIGVIVDAEVVVHTRRRGRPPPGAPPTACPACHRRPPVPPRAPAEGGRTGRVARHRSREMRWTSRRSRPGRPACCRRS